MDGQHNEALQLAQHLTAHEPGYRCRVLDDGSVACILDLMYTRAIILGCTQLAWSRRFCFEDKALANQRFGELHSQHDEPQGYIARR